MFLALLEQNLFKNVSNGLTVCDKRKFKRNDLNDTVEKERSYIDTWLIYTLWYEFLNDHDAQSDSQIFSQKSWSVGAILIF